MAFMKAEFLHFCSPTWPLPYLPESSISEIRSQIQISVIHSYNNLYSDIWQHKHQVTELELRQLEFSCQLSKKSERTGCIISKQAEKHVITLPSLSAESLWKSWYSGVFL